MQLPSKEFSWDKTRREKSSCQKDGHFIYNYKPTHET